MKDDVVPLVVKFNEGQTANLEEWQTGKILCSVSPDGKVMIGPDINLDDVKELPLPYLQLLREFINTAIYDKERK